MPTLVHVGSSKIVDEVNFLAFLRCHISGCMTPRPVKFSVWCLHYAGCQEMWALPHYLIYFKCIGSLKMGKKLQSEVLFMCLYSLKIWSDRWSAACYQQCSRCRCHTSDMAPVTEFTAVLWLCKYGKNLFFQFFECSLGGMGNWFQHLFFHYLLRIPRTLDEILSLVLNSFTI